jgi:hypothetical protein
MRRRLGLKIEAEESEKPRGGSANRGEEAHRQLSHAEDNDETRDQTGGEEGWWKREYRPPPPGHLGAHAIARDDEQRVASPSHARGGGESTGSEANEQAEVAGVEAEAAVTTTTSTRRPHLFETPERVKNRRTGGSDLFDSLTSRTWNRAS